MDSSGKNQSVHDKFIADTKQYVFHAISFILLQPGVPLDSILRRSYTFRDTTDGLSSPPTTLVRSTLRRFFLSSTTTTCSARQRESINYSRSVQILHKFRRAIQRSTIDRVHPHTFVDWERKLTVPRLLDWNTIETCSIKSHESTGKALNWQDGRAWTCTWPWSSQST